MTRQQEEAALTASESRDWEPFGMKRRMFLERAILTTSVCRELQTEEQAGDLAGSRSMAAWGLLIDWIRSAYGLPEGRPVDLRHGLDDPELHEFAPDLLNEILEGLEVCDALSFVYSAGAGNEFNEDMARLRRKVQAFGFRQP